MSMTVEVTPQMKQETAAILAQPVKQQAVKGYCAGCNLGIPHGYVCLVTRWEKVMHGTIPVSVPAEMWCKNCRDKAVIPDSTTSSRPRMAKVEPELLTDLSPKEIALRLLSAAQPRKSYTPEKLSRHAGVAFSPMIVKILEKLKEKGKLAKDGEEWHLA